MRLAFVSLAVLLLVGCNRTPERGTIEQQRACAEQSSKFVKRFPDPARFTDHFVPSLNKCFVTTVSVHADDALIEAQYKSGIYDAFEETSYGSITYKINPGAKEPTLTSCAALTADGRSVKCTSEQQWRDLTAYTR